METKNEAQVLMLKKALAYTNLVYAMSDSAESFVLDIEEILSYFGKELNRAERRKLKNIRKICRMLLIWLRDFAKKIYGIQDKELAMNVSDNLYGLLSALVLRVLDDEARFEEIYEYILANYDSKLEPPKQDDREREVH